MKLIKCECCGGNQWQKKAGNIMMCSFCGSVYQLDNNENIISREKTDAKVISLYFDAEKCRQVKNYVEEIQYLTQAIELDENRTITWVKLGRAYRLIGMYDRAIECYNRAIEIDSKFAQSYVNLGAICILREDYKKAIDYYEKGLDLFVVKDNDYLIALGNYGIAVAKNGDKRRGAKLINKAEKMGYTSAEEARKMAGLGFFSKFCK